MQTNERVKSLKIMGSLINVYEIQGVEVLFNVGFSIGVFLQFIEVRKYNLVG